jgi:hypothetical protein
MIGGLHRPTRTVALPPEVATGTSIADPRMLAPLASGRCMVHAGGFITGRIVNHRHVTGVLCPTGDASRWPATASKVVRLAVTDNCERIGGYRETQRVVRFAKPCSPLHVATSSVRIKAPRQCTSCRLCIASLGLRRSVCFGEGPKSYRQLSVFPPEPM